MTLPEDADEDRASRNASRDASRDGCPYCSGLAVSCQAWRSTTIF